MHWREDLRCGRVQGGVQGGPSLVVSGTGEARTAHRPAKIKKGIVEITQGKKRESRWKVLISKREKNYSALINQNTKAIVVPWASYICQ
jgi:hypothetical protein